MDFIKFLLMALPSILLAAVGIGIRYFKAYWLISGYNTMSEAKKKNVDVENLGRAMGNFCFFLAALILVILLSFVFDLYIPAAIGIVLFVSGIIVFLVKVQKYDGNAVDSNGRMTVRTKVIVGSIIAFILVIGTGVGILLFQGGQAAAFLVSSDRIEIDGMYGGSIVREEIGNVVMLEEMPEITMRTNGASIGGILKGYFDVTGYGNARLFVDVETPPFILMETQEGAVFLNCATRGETQLLFDKITDMLKK